MRTSSGKFSLSAFGRKDHGSPSSNNDPGSPQQTTGWAGARNNDGPESPGRENGEGFGKKLGKSLAHNSLLPSLGNKDVRALQDVIASEKGVLQAMERLAQETEKASATLPVYGQQEGPDLQDILTHSATLLHSLGAAFQVFVNHQARMRTTLKRIREREEILSDMRSRRRNTGSKAETAERKLAKMGPENKALPGQTDLLEKLRQEMRQLDTEIVNEESKLGDFKRQVVKESLSLKFGGLEELGEKMCIIGELGKLLLEEVPLEETPPGYGRAPYQGWEKTENAVNEAQKCLATVQFHAGSTAPKAPALPNAKPHAPLTPTLNTNERIAAAQDFGHYPQNAPPAQYNNRQQYGLDDNPYGGMADIHGNQQPNENHAYREYGGTRPDGQVVWQGPTEEALHTTAGYGGEGQPEHAYEYEQAQAAAAEREGAPQLPQLAVDGEGLGGEQAEWGQGRPGEIAPGQLSNAPTPINEGGRGWEPLNLKREISSNAPTDAAAHTQSNVEAPAVHADTEFGGAVGDVTTTDAAHPAEGDGYAYHHQTVSPVIPPPPVGAGLDMTPSGSAEGYHTPLEAPPTISTAPRPASPSLASPGAGKISAAAFRKGARPRMSGDGDDIMSPTSPAVIDTVRRLPVPPAGAPEFPPGMTAQGYPDEKAQYAPRASGGGEGAGAFADAPEGSHALPPVPAPAPIPVPAPVGEQGGLTEEEMARRGPPPSYGGTSGGDSLR